MSKQNIKLVYHTMTKLQRSQQNEA